MTSPRQRLLDALELVNALAPRTGTRDDDVITPAFEKAREELRESARAYVAAKQETEQ